VTLGAAEGMPTAALASAATIPKAAASAAAAQNMVVVQKNMAAVKKSSAEGRRGNGRRGNGRGGPAWRLPSTGRKMVADSHRGKGRHLTDSPEPLRCAVDLQVGRSLILTLRPALDRWGPGVREVWMHGFGAILLSVRMSESSRLDWCSGYPRHQMVLIEHPSTQKIRHEHLHTSLQSHLTDSNHVYNHQMASTDPGRDNRNHNAYRRRANNRVLEIPSCWIHGMRALYLRLIHLNQTIADHARPDRNILLSLHLARQRLLRLSQTEHSAFFEFGKFPAECTGNGSPESRRSYQ
jgi:hypothetical protein